MAAVAEGKHGEDSSYLRHLPLFTCFNQSLGILRVLCAHPCRNCGVVGL